MLFTTMTAMLWAEIASLGLPRREQGCRSNAGKQAEGVSPARGRHEGSQRLVVEGLQWKYERGLFSEVLLKDFMLLIKPLGTIILAIFP